jgi:hypothetical protein
MNYVDSSEDEDVELYVLRKEDKQKISTGRRFYAHNVGKKIIIRDKVYLLKLESLRYTS